MELMQLRYFRCLAYGYTMQQASDMLHISQSTLSMSMKKLEEEYHTKFFNRSGRTLQLNDNGRLLLASAERILGEVEQIENVFHSSAVSADKTAIVCTDAIDYANEAALLFSKLKPEFNIDIIRCDNCISEAWSISSHANLVISMEPFTHNVASSQLLLSEPMLLLIPPEQLKEIPDLVSITSLDGCRLVTGRADSALGILFDTFFQTAQVNPAKKLEVTDVETLAFFVSTGQGISFIPQSCMLDEKTSSSSISRLKIAARAVLEPFCCRNVYMASLKNGTTTASELFNDFLLKFTQKTKKFGHYPSLKDFEPDENAPL